MTMAASTLRPMVGDLKQIASVRRIVLDDGTERGVRALAFSTGGGLDFWAMADRSLDIGTLSWRGIQLGWQSPAGFRAPSLSNADGDNGRGFSRAFSGFLVTCGLDHIRQPGDGSPLHGHLPHTPARITAYGEDWSTAPVLYCEGEIIQWRHNGESYCLRRRIEAPIGGSSVKICDQIENIGPEPLSPQILYHFNLGFPAIASGTVVRLDGAQILDPIVIPDSAAPLPATLHASSNGDQSLCVIETPGEPDGYRISLRYDRRTLPRLQLWRDLRPRVGVLSIEPCNVGAAIDGANEQATPLAPGETVSFELEVSVETFPSTTHRISGHG